MADAKVEQGMPLNEIIENLKQKYLE